MRWRVGLNQKLHFPWSEIEKLLTEVITAKTARPLYGKETGNGLCLVGDQGVLLMAHTNDGEVNSSRVGERSRQRTLKQGDAYSAPPCEDHELFRLSQKSHL